jgi:lipid-A-disaccharide synthase
MLAQDPSLQFLLPVADPVYRGFFDREIDRRGLSSRVVLCDDSHEAMRGSDLLIVASGTATLEAALLGVPMVIIYKVSAFTMAVVRTCIHLGLIEKEMVGLPNLLGGRELVPELRNRLATAPRVASEAFSLLVDGPRRRAIEESLRQVGVLVSGGGSVDLVAEAILARAEPGGKVASAQRAAPGGLPG